MFRLALIVSGALALIALASPSLVVLGFFLLIIPGLILSLAPTVFVYLLLIAIIRTVAPIPPGVPGWVASVILAAAIGWAATLPMRQVETLRWRAQIKPEVIPSEPLKLSGDVRLERPPAFRRKEEGLCDYLCAALLDTPGITSVTVSNGDAFRRFTLVPKGSVPDEGIRPVEPQNILSVFDKIDAQARHAKYGNIRKFDET